MTLDEAIKHAEEVAEDAKLISMMVGISHITELEQKKCAEEHRQLAEWLKELKRLKEAATDTDTISRQAAQTELMMKCERYTLARESNGMGHVEWSSDLISVADAMDAIRDLPSAEPEIVRCKDCKNSEHWYRDRRRCFLWSEDGVSVFDDGFCSYAERRTDG